MKRGGERGQATVEFALIIPLVFIVLLAVVQVCVVAYAQLAVTHIARETARTLAVDPTADVGHLVDDRATWGTEDVVIQVHFDQSPTNGRETVTVTVSYRSEPILGLFSRFSDRLEVRSEVRMLVET